MKHIKSHFKFTTGQRNGIFLLLLIVVTLQCIYFYLNFSNESIEVDENKFAQLQEEIDSLRVIQIEENKPKIFPFNPNYISDFKGYSLGMSNEEIDRLMKFRAQNKWINSVQDFQKVTGVSDSLLNTISSLFKFPEWITNPQKKNFNSVEYSKTPKSFDKKIDLNKASASQLRRVNGVGAKLSERIVAFRNKFKGGFIADVQLLDVYGLSPEVISRITNEFTVKTPRGIDKINLNLASSDDLVTIQHIDYELAHEIIEQRTLREGFKSFDELLKVKDFPASKIEIIKLYLLLD
jgi:DNA uptake protein ComE-like DNA-binding protein